MLLSASSSKLPESEVVWKLENLWSSWQESLKTEDRS